MLGQKLLEMMGKLFLRPPHVCLPVGDEEPSFSCDHEAVGEMFLPLSAGRSGKGWSPRSARRPWRSGKHSRTVLQRNQNHLF